MRNTILFAASALLLVSGCAEKRESVSDVRIAPAIKSRVSGLHFEKDDCIGLTIVKGAETYVANQPMTYDGSTFTGSGLLWYNDLNQTSTLTAYYPYSAGGAPAEFSVATDQTGGCEPSDLLGAVKRDVTPVSAPVGMLFYHLMSQLTIVVTNNSDAAVRAVTVGGLIPTAIVDLSVPTAAVKTGAAVADIKAFEVTPDAAYRAVLVPQQATLTVTVATADGKSRDKTLSSALLESGKRYDMSVVVTNIDINLSLSGDINDWGDGGSLEGEEGGNGGGGDEGGEPSDLIYEGETYRTAKIGGRVWMTQNLRHMPAGAVIGSGVWYPSDGSSSDISSADPSAVAALGLLYDYATATGGAAARAGTPLRGICPEGWHIPDAAELQSLAESADRSADFFSYPGLWNRTLEKYGDKTKGFLMGSGSPESGRCDCLSYTLAPDPSVGATSAVNGISLRCVRDQAAQ